MDMNIAQTGRTHGIYPWNIPRRKITDTYDRQFYGGDRKEQIAICLNCPHEECINCVEHRQYKKENYHYIPSTKRAEERCRVIDKFKELYNGGMNYHKIVTEMKISSSTYYRYKKIVEGAKRA